jgi:aryl-alcohol dehydrogenase-like predicted oxidoreductase
MASDKQVSVSAVAIAWLLHRPAVTAPIIGANSREQVADLLSAADLKLSDHDVRRLSDASEPFTRKQPA